MKDAQTRADLQAAIGQMVRLVGAPVDTKASPRLMLLDGSGVDCRIGDTHWPEEYAGRTIAVTGRVVERSGPSFPVATQDDEGGWSQGVTAPAGLLPAGLEASDPLGEVGAPTALGSAPEGELLIRVTAHELVS